MIAPLTLQVAKEFAKSIDEFFILSALTAKSLPTVDYSGSTGIGSNHDGLPKITEICLTRVLWPHFILVGERKTTPTATNEKGRAK